ncbi:Acidic leucine-rich nuclear phosphoprotein 32 family member B [Pseudolycoriella hygida]|uniref:Acidic leucine-rich nuclear phosphoprotein 32 family member B n=1 Tax=Pseudolycoriella hygida TaxID=35572 RepID=A0A9Q0MZ78_9DIPT|nr:Acidic leucine-rich nuclear phosphoprotein 32 family member B [Pseudolycoriella hygida]
MRNVRLTSLEGFPYLPKLNELHLDRNRLFTGLSILAQNAPKLKHLHLSNNKFKHFEELLPLKHLTKLFSLSLDGNKVSLIKNYREDVLSLVPWLTVFDGCSSQEEPEQFKHREELKILNDLNRFLDDEVPPLEETFKKSSVNIFDDISLHNFGTIDREDAKKMRNKEKLQNIPAKNKVVNYFVESLLAEHCVNIDEETVPVTNREVPHPHNLAKINCEGAQVYSFAETRFKNFFANITCEESADKENSLGSSLVINNDSNDTNFSIDDEAVYPDLCSVMVSSNASGENSEDFLDSSYGEFYPNIVHEDPAGYYTETQLNKVFTSMANDRATFQPEIFDFSEYDVNFNRENQISSFNQVSEQLVNELENEEVFRARLKHKNSSEFKNVF